MKVLDKLTANSKQRYTLIGESGELIPFYLQYMPTQQGWMLDVGYGDFQFNGGLLQNSPNILRNFRNILPFGLACVTMTGAEPLNIDDFVTGRIKLYLLNRNDVNQIEEIYFS